MSVARLTPRRALFAAALAAATLAAGCSSMWQQARFQRDVETAFRLPAGTGVFADTANGQISVQETERDDVRVVANIRAVSQERADAVQIVGQVEGDWLKISAVWPDQRKGSEGVSFTIEAPGGRAVKADSSNGAITVTGFEGGVNAHTSNGAITVTSHQGPIHADTSNGRITVGDATGAVNADTSNGAVHISLADGNYGPVQIDSSNGSVTLVVGRDFAGTVHADTSNGSVTTAGAGITSATGTKKSKTVQIGEGGEKSTISTSNGAVTVQTRG